MKTITERIGRDHRFLSFAMTGVLIGLSLAPLMAQDGSVTSLNNSPWKVAPQGNVTETGEQLSTPGYAAGAWLTAHVPGTAFGDHVIAGLEPDPNFGQNVWNLNRKKHDQNYWYRTDFTVPADYFQGGRIWLNLDGVHRDGDVYVNGTMVGSMLGFFQRGRFDVTSLVQANGTNSLAVLAHLMVVPDVKGPDGQWNFNQSSPSLLCSRGWDWMPRVPGLNTGNATLSGQTNAGIILDDSENHNLTVGGTTALAITLTNSTGFYVNNEGTLTLPSTGKALTIGTGNT